jgi:hypothetical protein
VSITITSRRNRLDFLLKGNPVPRFTATIVFVAAAMFAAHANAQTPSCPPVTSAPGLVRTLVEGSRRPLGEVRITYNIGERSVCAAFTANPQIAKAIDPGTICYDVSVYGRLTQRGDAVVTAALLDGSQRELRLDHDAEIEMSTAYLAYTDDCLGHKPDTAKPAL